MKPSHKKNRLSTYLIILILSIICAAQPVHITETMANLLNVPSLSNPTSIPPDNNALSPKFDKRILVEISSGKEMFLYLNTTYGQIGFMTGRAGTLGNGELNYNDPKFTFTYFHPAGVVYTFYNSKTNNELTHRFTTGNTHIQTMDFSQQINGTVRKQRQTKSFFPQNFRAQAYKASNPEAPTIFLYGASFPLELIGVKMLGYNGIGYVLTNHAIYLVLEMNSATGSFEAKKWENVNLEFDFTSFGEQTVEDEAFQKGLDQIEIKKQKIQNDVDYSESCAFHEADLKEAKLTLLEEQEEALQKAKSGNIHSSETQAALMALPNYLGQLEVGAKEIDLKICKLQERISNAITAQDQSSLEEIISCYRNQKIDMEALYQEIQAIDANYSTNPLQGNMEKQRVFGSRLMDISMQCK